MVYLNIECEIKNSFENKENLEKLELSQDEISKIKTKMVIFNCENKRINLFAYEVSVDFLHIIGLSLCDVMPSELQKDIQYFLHKCAIVYSNLIIEEVTENRIRKLLCIGEHYGLCDIHKIKREYRLEYWDYIEDVEEYICDCDVTKTQLLKKGIFAMGESLCKEIERIYASKKQMKFIGIPVHYFIISKSSEFIDGATKALTTALASNSRIISRRVSKISLNNCIAVETLHEVFENSKGGVVVINVDSLNDDSDILGEHYCIETACYYAKQYKHKVQTIFTLNMLRDREIVLLKKKLEGMTFIEIEEQAVAFKTTKNYIKEFAKTHNISEKKFLETINIDKEKVYCVSELDELINDHYDNYLCNNIYTQYSKANTSITCNKKDRFVNNDAKTELDVMVGLDSIKQIIYDAINFYKLELLFKDKELSFESPSRHMVFTGNPGTAKTTVARLFAKIMQDNGVLSEGKLIEVGRADIIGKYVGWTAPKVKEIFKKARGSVLFIDEAYSLIDDRQGMYGDEAINTIIQEMENNRDNVIVIFAGYPKLMQQFIDRNPGIKSRVAFNVNFPDYSQNQLFDILKLMLKKTDIVLDEGAEQQVQEIIRIAQHIENFGNGRFVRNMLEQARIRQASRIMELPQDKISADDCKTLIAEDFIRFKADIDREAKINSRLGF